MRTIDNLSPQSNIKILDSAQLQKCENLNEQNTQPERNVFPYRILAISLTKNTTFMYRLQCVSNTLNAFYFANVSLLCRLNMALIGLRKRAVHTITAIATKTASAKTLQWATVSTLHFVTFTLFSYSLSFGRINLDFSNSIF